MKKLFNVLILTLALNFLAVGGIVAWLQSSGHLDKTKAAAIGAILFPTSDPAKPDTRPSDGGPDPATQPTVKLEALLAKHSGMSTGEQVEFIQRTFDAHMAQLDRRERELQDRERRLLAATQEATQERTTLTAGQQKLADQQAAAKKEQLDQGFQDSLRLYNTMPGKQVKTIFMSLDDDTVIKYLTAMEPRTAGRIVKEFKAPDETTRVQRVLEKMRQAQASSKE